MRIISGQFKGRKLVSFKADHIRPTTDRVKESLFNTVMADIAGRRVLDLFSGTGNLGFEAVSRGADYVESVESNKKSLQIIQANKKLLGIKSGHVVCPIDVFKYLKSYEGLPFDVVLVDPPFTQSLAHPTMELLTGSGAVSTHTLIAIESSHKERLDESYGVFQIWKQNAYGDKYLTFYVTE